MVLVHGLDEFSIRAHSAGQTKLTSLFEWYNSVQFICIFLGWKLFDLAVHPQMGHLVQASNPADPSPSLKTVIPNTEIRIKYRCHILVSKHQCHRSRAYSKTETTGPRRKHTAHGNLRSVKCSIRSFCPMKRTLWRIQPHSVTRRRNAELNRIQIGRFSSWTMTRPHRSLVLHPYLLLFPRLQCQDCWIPMLLLWNAPQLRLTLGLRLPTQSFPVS